MKQIPTLRLLTLGILIAFGSSCSSLIGLRGQVERLENRGGITVKVSPIKKGGPATYVVAWRMDEGMRKDSAGFQKVRADGFASFQLNLDNLYHIGAFTDEIPNGAYDSGEPLAVERGVKPVSLSDPAQRIKIHNLTLKRDHGLPAGTVIRIPEQNEELGGKLNLALGDVVSLDEKRFEPEAGGRGLWRPLDFLGGNTTGLYFTEPYDPRRIPVVFVYGIGGSPQDWRYFIDHFDRSRHQLWFYHYPSGMRLARVSGVLAESLRVLKQRYGFDRCDVVAHSMGGLVASAAIRQAVTDEGENFIPKFVSISTPWGGHKAAESGIRHLKKPVPSWLDVTPGSGFLTGIHATPLPSGTRHQLIYGSIQGGPFWLKEKNDGVVTVASETDPRIVESTVSVQHLLREHVEILQQQETVGIVEKFLEQ